METVTETKLYSMDVRPPLVFVMWGVEAIGVAGTVEGAWDIMTEHAAQQRGE